MKNAFKFLGLVLLAGALTMVSCGKDEETPANTNTEQNGGDNNGGNSGGDTNSTTRYTLTVVANNSAYGTVTGGGQYEAGAQATLTATPNGGYAFDKWNDGNTENPRTVTVNADATYTAIFLSTATASAHVTAGDAEWDAAYISGAIAANGFNMFLGKTDGSHMPLVNIYCSWEEGTSALGTHSGAPAIVPNGEQYSIQFGNPYVYYFNRGQVNFSMSSGTKYTGDWWAKNVTVSITEFDATSGHMSASVSGTLVYVKDTIFAVDSTTNMLQYLNRTDFESVTSPFSVTLTNIALTPQTGKGLLPKESVVRARRR